MKVARVHEHITNARKDYLDKISTEIIKNHEVIDIENLQVSNMLKNGKLAKAISEVSWSQFRNKLEYKAKWYRKQVVVVSKIFTASQLCSSCGYQNKDIKSINLRECHFPPRGTHHDRDINTGLNLRNYGDNLVKFLYLEISRFKHSVRTLSSEWFKYSFEIHLYLITLPRIILIYLIQKTFEIKKDARKHLTD